MSDQPAVVFEQDVFRVLQPSGTTVLNVEDTTTPDYVKEISEQDISNWNEAYSWGNHASVGYLTSVSLNGYATENWVNNNFQPIGDYIAVGDSFGDITTGDIEAGAVRASSIISMVYRSDVNGRAGFVFGSGNNILPTDYRGAVNDGFVDLGMNDGRFKDGWFSNVVYARDYVSTYWRSNISGRAGLAFGSRGAEILPTDGFGSANDGVVDIGREEVRFADGFFAGSLVASTFVGDGSGLTNLSVTDSNDNVVLGTDALRVNTTGFRNVSSGVNTLFKNTTGAYNTAIGYGSSDTNATGRNNTTLGAFTDVAAPDLTNATAVGYGAIVDASNKIQLGDANVTLVQTFGTVQAAGFLDADGNSIGSPEIDYPISFDINGTDVTYVYSDSYPVDTIRPDISASPSSWSAKFLPTENQTPNEIFVDRNNLNIKTGRSSLLLGPSQMAIKAGNCVIALNDRDPQPHITAYSTVETDELTFKADIFEANDYRDLNGDSLVGLFAMDFAHSFTKLQTAVRDETTIEGVKDALVNALGGLIEEFEAKANSR